MHARIVDQYLDRCLVGKPLQRRGGRATVGHVERDCRRASAIDTDLLDNPLGGESVGAGMHHNVQALTCQLARNRGADYTAAAGNQCSFQFISILFRARKFSHAVLSFAHASATKAQA